MMKRKGRIISAVTAAAVATGTLAWSAFADSVPVANPYKVTEGELLGVATHFHLFAEEVVLSSHVHGNVATNMLYATGDFGVRPENLKGYGSINYIKDFATPLNGDTLSTKLVVGSGVEVEYTDNGNRVKLTSASAVLTDWEGNPILDEEGNTIPVTAELPFTSIKKIARERADAPYIDIAKELAAFAEMSESLAAMENTAGIDPTYDGNEIVIDCAEAEGQFMYYTLRLDDVIQEATEWSDPVTIGDYLLNNAQLKIKNVDFENGEFLYLTIDVGDRDDVTFNKSWLVYKNGTDEEYGHGETPLDEGGGRILYNFVSNGSAYEGKLTYGEVKLGSTLAPKAEIESNGNTNGTMIAKKITCKGESHRWDVQKQNEFPNEEENSDEEEVTTTSETTVVTTSETTKATTKATTSETTKATTTSETTKATTTSETTKATTTSETTKATTTSETTKATTTSETTKATTTSETTKATTTSETTKATTTSETTKATTVATTTEATTTEATTTEATTTEATTTEATTTEATTTEATTEATTTAAPETEATTTTTEAPKTEATTTETTTTEAPKTEAATTTTTAEVANEDEEKTTTTTTAVVTTEAPTTTFSPEVEGIQEEFNKDPQTKEEIEELIEKIDELLQTDSLTDEDRAELERIRDVLGERVSRFYDEEGEDELPNTGDGLGITLAILAGVTVAAAVFAGRKRLEEEE